MSTSQPVPDTVHPALEPAGPRPPSPSPASPPSPPPAAAASANHGAAASEKAEQSRLVPPIHGERADGPFLATLRQEAHRHGGVLHHSIAAELQILLSDRVGRAALDIAPKRPRILLPPNATRYEALTQVARLRHWHDAGRDEYRTMPPLARAQGDFDRLVADPGWRRFTGAERAHAAAIVLNLGGQVDRAELGEVLAERGGSGSGSGSGFVGGGQASTGGGHAQ